MLPTVSAQNVSKSKFFRFKLIECHQNKVIADLIHHTAVVEEFRLKQVLASGQASETSSLILNDGKHYNFKKFFRSNLEKNKSFCITLVANGRVSHRAP